MTGTLKAQLAQYSMTERLSEVLEETVRVREELGHPIVLTKPGSKVGSSIIDLARMIGGIAVLVIAKNWTKIKNGAKGAKDFVVGKFNDLLGFFRGLPGRMSSAVSGLFNRLLQWFFAAFNTGFIRYCRTVFLPVLMWTVETMPGMMGRLSPSEDSLVRTRTM